MTLKALLALATAALALVPFATAQQPLSAMPYSPSLDLSSLDRSIDPCTDFYKFSCGGWQTKNPIPADQATWSVYGKLANDNQQFLWGILKEDAVATTNRSPVQQKVGDFFAACMDTAAIDAAGLKPLAPQLARIDDLHSRPELVKAIATLEHTAMGSFFFGAGTDQDAIDSATVIVRVGAGGLGLPDRDYYLKTDGKSMELREQYVAYIQHLLTLAGDTPDHAKAGAADILRIETALAQASLSRVDRRDPHKTYHPMTVRELSSLAPAIDWPVFLKTQISSPAAPNINTLNVAQPDFLKAVNAELTSEPVDALRTYLRFHLLDAASPFLAHPFEQAHFDFFGHTLRGIPAMLPRWKTCTRGVDSQLGEALGQEFVRRTFSADMKSKTQRMTLAIEAAMRSEIQALDWMSPATKQEALRKLSAIRNKIGYPDQWRDYTALTITPTDFFGNQLRSDLFEIARDWNKLGKPVDLTEWGMSPPTVNAYFNPQMNDINFPAGVLQPPLYDVKLDDAPNFGNTGATIGHELTHAFDDEGRQFDSKGNLRDWWTPADAKGFEDRINCVRDQYAQYIVVDDIHINAKLTSGEDVADLGGTLLAYIAWQKQLATTLGAPSSTTASSSAKVGLQDPPGKIDGFTPDQRFFIGMAQWACEIERPENLRVSAVTDPHSPGFARINGVVSNLPQFQAAFACKTGQPMVHIPTCRVW